MSNSGQTAALNPAIMLAMDMESTKAERVQLSQEAVSARRHLPANHAELSTGDAGPTLTGRRYAMRCTRWKSGSVGGF